jgi:hypothetical protein
MATLPEQCCTLPPFKSDYSPVGKRFSIQVDGQADLEIYSTGPEDAQTVIVAIYGVSQPLYPAMS